MPPTLRYLPFADWPAALWRVLIAVWCLFWLLMLSVAIQDNWRSADVLWWQPLLSELSSALFVTCIGLLMLVYGVRRHHLLATPWYWFWQHLKWLPVVSALFVVVVYGLRHGIYTLLGEQYVHQPWLQVWTYETIKLGLFLGLWLGVVFGVHVFVAWRAQQLKLQALQQALTEARLQHLKAQLQPHFLFNTLNTISAYMHSDVLLADKVLNQLADLLRARLTPQDQHLVPLAEELRLLRLYADIMCVRFAPRVSLQWHIADAALALNVPILVLQPLLENVFRHEVERSAEPVQVSIQARVDGGWLEIAIRNSVSVAITPGPESSSHGTGIGLRNCRERVAAIHGPGASLVSTREEGRFSVVLRLPGAGP